MKNTGQRPPTMTKQIIPSCQPDNQQSALNDQQIATLHTKLPDWQITEIPQQIKCIQYEYQFTQYRLAVDFTLQVANLAEQHQHHPEIVLTYKTVLVRWWTHQVMGLQEQDFICAQQTDRIYQTYLSNESIKAY